MRAVVSKYVNEVSASIKDRKILYQLSDYRLFKKDPVPWSCLRLGGQADGLLSKQLNMPCVFTLKKCTHVLIVFI
jgi:hypothetical protein